MIDACVITDDFSGVTIEIEPNTTIAHRARTAIIDTLSQKGYPVVPESVVTVGAALPSGRRYMVIENGKEFSIEPSLGIHPPFYGEPAWWREKRAALNTLFYELSFEKRKSGNEQNPLASHDLALVSDTALIIQIYGVSPSDNRKNADLAGALITALATRGQGASSSSDHTYWVGFHLIDTTTRSLIWSNKYRVRTPWSQLSPPDSENALDLVREVIESIPARRLATVDIPPAPGDAAGYSAGRTP